MTLAVLVAFAFAFSLQPFLSSMAFSSSFLVSSSVAVVLGTLLLASGIRSEGECDI